MSNKSLNKPRWHIKKVFISLLGKDLRVQPERGVKGEFQAKKTKKKNEETPDDVRAAVCPLIR